MSKFLCDDCKWDYRSACHNPRRPNVRWDEDCKDYSKRDKIRGLSENPFDPKRVGYYKGEGRFWSWLRRIFGEPSQ